MKITKYVHSCLLVEMPEPVNRTVLFDPGGWSAEAIPIDDFAYLDDIIITHSHGDHYNPEIIARLRQKFPEVRITAPHEVALQLEEQGIADVLTEPSDGIVFFAAPHEAVEPLFPQPEQIGIHYLDTLTHPGDSHSFNETKSILALPVTTPWGSTIRAIKLALALKPQYVLPIHDWHWSDAARSTMYNMIGEQLSKHGITFVPLQTGKPVVITEEGVHDARQ